MNVGKSGLKGQNIKSRAMVKSPNSITPSLITSKPHFDFALMF